MASGIESRSPFLLEYRMLAANALELTHHVGNVDAGSEGQRNEPPDGLGLGGHGMPGLADGRENLERLAVHLVHRKIHAAEAGLHLFG